MNSDYQDINKKVITSTPVTSTPVSAETIQVSKSTTPVPVGKRSEKKEDPVTTYINSAEFLDKTPEEQLAELQKQFPNIDKQQLSATLSAVKSTIENKKDDVEEATTSSTEPKELSEGEKALNECEAKLRQKGKKDVTIEDVISDIIRTPEAKRTPEQIKALEHFENVHNEVKNAKMQQIATLLNKYGSVWDNAIPQEVIQSDEWKKLNPQQKFEKHLDAVLVNVIPDYDKKSDAEKEILLSSMKTQLGQLTVRPPETWEGLSIEKQKVRLAMVAIAAEAAEAKGIKIGDIISLYKENPKKIQQELASYAIEKVIQNFDIKTALKDGNWAKLSGEEQLCAIVDSAAESLYPDFKNLSKAQQSEIEASIKNHIGFSKYGKDWIEFSEKEKGLKLQSLMSEFSAICFSKKSLSAFRELPVSEQLRAIERYEIKANIQIPPTEQLRRSVMIKNNKREITDADVKKYILAIPEAKRTKTQRFELDRIRVSEEEGRDITKPRKDYYESTEYVVDQHFGGDYRKFLEGQQLGDEEIKILINNCTTLDGIFKLTEVLDISDEDLMTKFKIDKQKIIDAHSKYTVEGKGKDAARTENLVANSTKKLALNLVDKLQSVYIKQNKENVKALSEHNIEGIRLMGADYAKNAAAATNTYCSSDIAENVHMSVACASHMPEAAMAVYSQSAIETAHSDQDRYRFMQAMSSSDNSAVMEGLAAASKSVKDPGLRRQYDSYVDNVIQSYPPETQSRIRHARETGEVSEYTMSQTSVSGEARTSKIESKTSVTDNSSERRTEASQTPKAQAQVGGTNATAASSGSSVASTVGKTQNKPLSGIVSNASVTSSNASSASSIAAKTSATNIPKAVSGTENLKSSIAVEPMNDKEVEVLTKKAEAVLEKIENFIETQAKSIEQREAEKAAQSTAESATAAMSEDEIIDAITSSDIDVSKLENLNLSEEEKETLRKSIAVIFENNSVSAAYTKFISKFGETAKMKFLEAFASKADATSIRSFANDHKNDSKLISILYQYSQDSSLIAYLPKDELFNLLMKGKISDLSKINPDILADYIQERMKSEKNPKNLLGYLKLLPLEYQGAVLNQYPDLAEEVHGSDKWLAKNNKRAAKTSTTQTPEQFVSTQAEEKSKENKAFMFDENFLVESYPTFDDGLAMGSTTVPNPRGKNERYDKRKIKGHIYMKG